MANSNETQDIVSDPLYLHFNDLVLVTQILISDNYNSWYRSMRFPLKGKNKFCYVDGSFPYLEDGDSKHCMLIASQCCFRSQESFPTSQWTSVILRSLDTTQNWSLSRKNYKNQGRKHLQLQWCEASSCWNRAWVCYALSYGIIWWFFLCQRSNPHHGSYSFYHQSVLTCATRWEM